jgi:hypothetical protein
MLVEANTTKIFGRKINNMLGYMDVRFATLSIYIN